MPPCPSDSTLHLLGTPLLGDQTLVGLEDHVAGCPACQEALERLAREETATATAEGAARRVDEPAPTIPGFLIEGTLGRGGMGVVYLARDVNLGRQVALKLVPVGPTSGPRAAARWLEEARSHSRVRHPSVVQIHEVREAGDWAVLVLEYVPGKSLQERLDGPLAPRPASALIEAVARAVGRIHRAGLVHLDLKPSNILLDGEPGAPWEEAQPKVADFGIARREDDPCGAGLGATRLEGTPAYMAPEQVHAHRGAVDGRADVYALGAILYRLLTGRPPFQAPTVVEVLEQVREAAPVPPRQLGSRIPRDLETICLKCLEKDPARRYASADELAGDLRRWLDGRPIAARRASWPERSWRWSRRRPAVALLLTALAATLVASFSALVWTLGRTTAERDRAEAARRRAEDYERIAARSLREMVPLVSRSFDVIELSREGRLQASVEAIRREAAALRRRSDVDAGILASIGRLDRLFALGLSERQGGAVAARELIAESVDLLEESLRKSPGDQDLLHELAVSTLHGADFAFREGRPDASERLFDRAVRLARGLRSDEERRKQLVSVSVYRHNHACRLGWAGERRRVRASLEADLRMLDSLDARDAASAPLQLRRALTLAALNRPEEGLEAVRAELRRLPPVVGPDSVPAYGLAEWFVLDAPVAMGDLGSLPEGDGPGLERWAASFVEGIRARCARHGAPEAMGPLSALRLSTSLRIGAAIQRKLGRGDEALRIERCSLVLARELVERYPTHASARMTLSEAYIEAAKNAWGAGDDEAAGRALRRSLAEARRALTLDPFSGEARRLVDDRERRLVGAVAGRPPADRGPSTTALR